MDQTTPAWLRLAKPIAAKLGDDAVLVLDLGAAGALLSGHASWTPGSEHDLAFAHGGRRVLVRCCITAVAEHPLPPDKDLLVRFREPNHELADFIARYEAQIHRAEEANAEGDLARNIIDGDRLLSDLGAAARTTENYLQCRLENGRWTRQRTAHRHQPAEGFTVSAAETEDQIGLLQLAYEESDADGRRLLQEFAAESLGGVVPARLAI